DFKPFYDRIQGAVTHEGAGHTGRVLLLVLTALGLTEDDLTCVTRRYSDGPPSFIREDPVPLQNAKSSLVALSESSKLSRAYYHELRVITNCMRPMRELLARDGKCHPATPWESRHGHDNYLPVDPRMQMSGAFRRDVRKFQLE